MVDLSKDANATFIIEFNVSDLIYDNTCNIHGISICFIIPVNIGR